MWSHTNGRRRMERKNAPMEGVGKKEEEEFQLQRGGYFIIYLPHKIYIQQYALYIESMVLQRLATT